MKTNINISKAQIEVWEWKEKAYEAMKHLSSAEQMKFIREQTAELAAQIKKNKQETLRKKV